MLSEICVHEAHFIMLRAWIFTEDMQLHFLVLAAGSRPRWGRQQHGVGRFCPYGAYRRPASIGGHKLEFVHQYPLNAVGVLFVIGPCCASQTVI